jgi:hypothetical protein
MSTSRNYKILKITIPAGSQTTPGFSVADKAAINLTVESGNTASFSLQAWTGLAEDDWVDLTSPKQASNRIVDFEDDLTKIYPMGFLRVKITQNAVSDMPLTAHIKS